jgi:hypothetical protein
MPKTTNVTNAVACSRDLPRRIQLPVNPQTGDALPAPFYPYLPGIKASLGAKKNHTKKRNLRVLPHPVAGKAK